MPESVICPFFPNHNAGLLASGCRATHAQVVINRLGRLSTKGHERRGRRPLSEDEHNLRFEVHILNRQPG